jgi:hypothetical protein
MATGWSPLYQLTTAGGKLVGTVQFNIKGEFRITVIECETGERTVSITRGNMLLLVLYCLNIIFVSWDGV